MGSGYNKMKKQARLLEEQMAKMQEEMQQKEVTGTSGNGLVTVVISGDKELKSIRIRPDCVNPEDVEGLQDLIAAACTDAYQKLGDQSSPFPLPPGMNLNF